MGRQPCCDKVGLKKGPWTAEEDRKLVDFIINNGHCCWRTVPKLAGLLRCGKSCRLRWTNYLRPDLKRGVLSEAEEKLIIELHSHLGNRWAKIAAHLPGRTDNEIKNYWNTHIKKKLKRMGIDPLTHQPIAESPSRAEQPALSEPLIVNAEAEQQAAARYDDTKPRLAAVAIPTMSMGEPKLRDSESVRGYEPPNVCKGPAVKTEILTMGGNMKEEVSDGTVSSGSNQSEVTYNILEDDKSIDSLTNRADIIPSRFGFGCSSMFGDHDVKVSVPVSSCKIEEKEPFGAQYNEKLEACQSWEPVGCNNAMLFDQQENGPLMLQGDDNLWGFADLVGCFNKGISSNSDGGMQSCNVGIESEGEFKWTNGHEPNNTDMLVTGSTLPAPGGESSGQLWLQAAVDPFLAWEGGSAVNSSQAFYPHELRRLAATLDSI